MVQIPDFLNISVDWLCTINSCFGNNQETIQTNQNVCKHIYTLVIVLNWIFQNLLTLVRVLLTSFFSSPPHPYIYRPQSGWSSTAVFTRHRQLDASFCCLFIYLCQNLPFTRSLKPRKLCSYSLVFNLKSNLKTCFYFDAYSKLLANSGEEDCVQGILILQTLLTSPSGSLRSMQITRLVALCCFLFISLK